MKKLIIAATALMCIVVALSSTNIRVAEAEVTSCTQIESGNHLDTWLTTADGEVWIVEGYTAPIGDKVLIVFDKCDRSTLYDDEIMYLMHFIKL